MIVFPNAKINLGLYITGKRPDGYHDISTVMVPVGWRDVLEITPSEDSKVSIITLGRKIECPPEKNLVVKAYNALSSFVGGLPPVIFRLEKIIPDGAGLGGGSADASFAILGLNDMFNLGLPKETLAKVAETVGADCPFFIYNRPALCEGKGEEISFNLYLSLKDKSILIVKPYVTAVSTREAYEGVNPKMPGNNIKDILLLSPENWMGKLINDFEPSIFKKLPVLHEVKNTMLENGARYASMTGSGAAVFGIFDNDNMAERASNLFKQCDKIVTRVLDVND